MGRMSSPGFNGSIDFSTLTAPAAGGNYVTEVDEASFDALAQKSIKHPVILEFYSPRAQGGQAVSDALAELANAAGGKYLVGRINVDEQPRIAQALQVQAVPTVVALIGGQVAPLFQGTAAKPEIAATMDQVVAAAAANGVIGRADPVEAAPAAGESAPAVDPRFTAADQALVAGDFAQAVVEFDKILAETPHDAEAIAGRAQASLLVRSQALDPSTLVADAGAKPADLAVQLQAADLEMINGAYEGAFDRLLGLAAEVDADGRERIRVRLLELFEIAGRSNPVVLKARRRLSGLLF